MFQTVAADAQTRSTPLPVRVAPAIVLAPPAAPQRSVLRDRAADMLATVVARGLSVILGGLLLPVEARCEMCGNNAASRCCSPTQQSRIRGVCR